MDIADLAQANPMLIGPDPNAPDGTPIPGSPPEIVREGGYFITPEGAGTVPAPAPTPVVQQPAQAPPAIPQFVFGQPEVEPQLAPQPPVQPAPPAQPPPPDAVPVTVYKEMRERYQVARDQGMALQARLQELEAWRQQNEPKLVATIEWLKANPGYDQRLAAAEVQKEVLEAQLAAAKNFLATIKSEAPDAQVPDLDSLAAQKMAEVELRRALNEIKLMPEILRTELSQRDAVAAKREAEMAERAAWEQAKQQFESEFTAVTASVPAVGNSVPFKKLVFNEWVQRGGRVPVMEVAAPYIDTLRSNVAAAQAAQDAAAASARAAVKTMPTTMNRPSGPAVPQAPSMPRPKSIAEAHALFLQRQARHGLR
jgi:hypothetical protein